MIVCQGLCTIDTCGVVVDLGCDITLENYSTNILVTTQSAARYATNIKHLSLQLDRQKFEVFGNV